VFNLQEILDSIKDDETLNSAVHRAGIAAALTGRRRLTEEDKVKLADGRRAAGTTEKTRAAVSAAAKNRHEAHRAAQEHLFLECINNPVLVKGRPSLRRSAQKYGVSTKAIRAYAKRIGIL